MNPSGSPVYRINSSEKELIESKVDNWEQLARSIGRVKITMAMEASPA